jgi:hypothetical protein
MSKNHRKKQNSAVPKKAWKRRVYLLFIIAPVLAAAAVLGLSRLGPGKFTWYVEEGLDAPWKEILSSGPGNFQAEPLMLPPGESPPANARGFFITSRRAEAEGPVTVYPRLSFDLEYQGAHVLAVDLWMLFRNHQVPPLSRRRIDSLSGGEGMILLPGRDEASIGAWTAQLLQESPGVFPEDRDTWDRTAASLFDNERFYQGSRTSNWNDVWFFLLGGRTSWVYASLSKVREQPDHRTNILEAAVFPGKNPQVISMQARILWAVPLGGEKTARQLDETLKWLKNAETQTLIADALHWLPADPDGKPYNPAAMTAKLAWLTASYVYELNYP